MALTGLMLELSGPDALLYQFSVEALFLGSPVMRVSGERIVLSGPTGREPLVGLRVALARTNMQNHRVVQAANQAHKQTERSAAAAAERLQRHRPASSSGRVRVFRSRPKEKPAT